MRGASSWCWKRGCHRTRGGPSIRFADHLDIFFPKWPDKSGWLFRWVMSFTQNDNHPRKLEFHQNGYIMGSFSTNSSDFEWWSLAGACCGTPCWRPGLVINLNRPQGTRCNKQSGVLPTRYYTTTCDSCDDQNLSLLSRFCAFVSVLFASIWWTWTF